MGDSSGCRRRCGWDADRQRRRVVRDGGIRVAAAAGGACGLGGDSGAATAGSCPGRLRGGPTSRPNFTRTPAGVYMREEKSLEEAPPGGRNTTSLDFRKDALVYAGGESPKFTGTSARGPREPRRRRRGRRARRLDGGRRRRSRRRRLLERGGHRRAAAEAAEVRAALAARPRVVRRRGGAKEPRWPERRHQQRPAGPATQPPLRGLLDLVRRHAGRGRGAAKRRRRRRRRRGRPRALGPSRRGPRLRPRPRGRRRPAGRPGRLGRPAEPAREFRQNAAGPRPRPASSE